MRNFLSLLAPTVTLTGAVTACRFVNTALAQAGVGENTYGVAQSDGAIGDDVAVSAIGTAVVESGGALSAGDLVESDASGRAVTRTTGAIIARLAPGELATAAGQFVEVILITN